MEKKLDHSVLVPIIEDRRSFNDFSKKFIQLAVPSKETFITII
jgi:hypothetical protein